MSCAIALRPFLASVARGSRAAASVVYPAPHAPHSRSAVAGPSRCFCTSARQGKASELPLDYSLHDVQQEFASDHDSPSFWPAPTFSQHPSSLPRISASYIAELPLYSDQSFPQPELPPIPLIPPTHEDEFFTSTVPTYQPSDAKGKQKQIQYAPLYVETLDSTTKTTFLQTARILRRSGERSMPALVSAMPGDQLSEEQREQLACLVLADSADQKQSPNVLWDLYLSWLQTNEVVYSAPPGPTRAPMCNLQAKTMYKCCVYLHTAGLFREAAAMANDTRLKPSQTRFLTRKLVFDRQLGATLRSRFEPASSPIAVRSLSLAWLNARLTLHDLAKTTCTLLVKGTAMDPQTLGQMLKLLCITSSHRWVLRLFRTAQRRAQLTLMGAADDVRCTDIAQFWRTRADEPPNPAVLDTPSLERVVQLLSSQKRKGADVAYKMVKSLPMEQRTKSMYDSLMNVYGHAPLASSAEVEQEIVGRGTQTGHRILQEMTTVPHLGGVTVETISSRVISHARARRWDAIRSDLAFLRTLELNATIHDLHPRAQHAVLRCGVETGNLLYTFGVAAELIDRSQTAPPPAESGTAVTPTSVVSTLLLSAQGMRAGTLRGSDAEARKGRASRGRLLMLFLSHYSQLHIKCPVLEPTWETLTLFVRLLAVHQRAIDTPTLWKLVRVLCDRFEMHDQRIVPLLLAFARVFQQRRDLKSCAMIQTLILRVTNAAVQ